jgi:hypothetical protein
VGWLTVGCTLVEGVDNVWEQVKLEARKMPETRHESRHPLLAVVDSVFLI